MIRPIFRVLVTVSVAVMLSRPTTAVDLASVDWDVAGSTLNETEKRWLAYMAIFVVPKLQSYYGTRTPALDSAAVVAWWTLTEGVMGFELSTHPKNPVSYSNCNGNKRQSATTECTSGAWQIGIGAIQSPYFGVDYFTDDDDNAFEGYINRIRQKGVTSGCSATEFCPGGYVPRKHMAAFLYRNLRVELTEFEGRPWPTLHRPNGTSMEP